MYNIISTIFFYYYIILNIIIIYIFFLFIFFLLISYFKIIYVRNKNMRQERSINNYIFFSLCIYIIIYIIDFEKKRFQQFFLNFNIS